MTTCYQTFGSANHISTFLKIPTSTHHCWVDRGRMDWGKPNTSTVNRQWQLNPRPFEPSFELKTIAFCTILCRLLIFLMNVQTQSVLSELYLHNARTQCCHSLFSRVHRVQIVSKGCMPISKCWEGHCPLINEFSASQCSNSPVCYQR